MDQQKKHIKVDDLVRRIREKLGKNVSEHPGQQLPLHSSPMTPPDWNRIEGVLTSADAASHVWTTKPRMTHYPGPLRWVATFVGKIILYFNQVVTKPQQDFNVAAVQTMASLRDGLSALNHNVLQVGIGMTSLAHELQSTQDSVSADFESIRESLKNIANTIESADTRLYQLEQMNVQYSLRIQLVEQLPARIAETEQNLANVQPRLSSLEEGARLLPDHTNALAALRRALDESRQNIAMQEQRLRIFLEQAKQQLPKKYDDAQLQKFSDELESMEDALYLAFEDKFRGPREVIKERVKIYLPLIRESNAGTESRPVLDVGCGRGEWLELLQENKMQGYGIDSNKAMVNQCEARGLRVKKSDVMTYLANVHDDSLGAITGFHIIEHLPFNVWIKLLDEAERTLQKGGLAIFETPNPENVIVGSNSFYLDPTHRNPLPSEMVKFMAEHRGFGRVEVLQLNAIASANAVHESTEVASRFNRYFYGPMDYAVLAWKL